jgi:flagellin
MGLRINTNVEAFNGQRNLSMISDIVSQTKFNGTMLLSVAANAINLQVGPNAGGNNVLTVTLPDLVTADPNATIGTLDAVLAQFVTGTMTNVLDDIDIYTDSVSAARANMGAVQNRLEYTIESLGIYQENLMAAESRIRDVDMAQEMTNFTKLQILQQSGTAMLAQANQASASVLSLLQ